MFEGRPWRMRCSLQKRRSREGEARLPRWQDQPFEPSAGHLLVDGGKAAFDSSGQSTPVRVTP